jgi:hypothetical protein
VFSLPGWTLELPHGGDLLPWSVCRRLFLSGWLFIGHDRPVPGWPLQHPRVCRLCGLWCWVYERCRRRSVCTSYTQPKLIAQHRCQRVR